jgi:hypothetical protein
MKTVFKCLTVVVTSTRKCLPVVAVVADVVGIVGFLLTIWLLIR